MSATKFNYSINNNIIQLKVILIYAVYGILLYMRRLHFVFVVFQQLKVKLRLVKKQPNLFG